MSVIRSAVPDRTHQLMVRILKYLVEMWLYRWTKTKGCKQYLKSIEIIEPLNPRDALYEGRTEVFKLRSDSKLLGSGGSRISCWEGRKSYLMTIFKTFFIKNSRKARKKFFHYFLKIFEWFFLLQNVHKITK